MTVFKAPHNALYYPYRGDYSLGVAGTLEPDTVLTQYVLESEGYDRVSFTKTGEHWHVHAEEYDTKWNKPRTVTLPIDESDVPEEVRNLIEG